MSEAQVPIPAWPRTKRIMVAVWGTLGVLMVGLVVGGGIYGIGSHLGWLSPNTINRHTLIHAASTDTKLARAVYTTARKEVCQSARWNFGMSFLPPIRVMQQEGTEACRQFEVPSAQGKKVRVYVSRHYTDRAEIVESIIASLSEVFITPIQLGSSTTDVTMIHGVRNEQGYVAYLLHTPHSSLVIEGIGVDGLASHYIQLLAEDTTVY